MTDMARASGTTTVALPTVHSELIRVLRSIYGESICGSLLGDVWTTVHVEQLDWYLHACAHRMPSIMANVSVISNFTREIE